MGNVPMKRFDGTGDGLGGVVVGRAVLSRLWKAAVGGSLALVGMLVVFSTPVLAVSGCPNEQLRGEDHSTQLPYCRAFELVGAPYKDGYEAFLGSEGLSPDGSRLIYNSIGVFAGTAGNDDVQGSIYEASRSSSGWLNKAISPPASILSFADLEDSSSDLTRTLWSAHTASQSADAQDLYVREPSGAFVRVGPEIPPSTQTAPPAPYQTTHSNQLTYAGASSDLSHIFFTLEPGSIGEVDIAWSGDETLLEAGANSLYEYTGVNNREPKLVAILNKGAIHNNSEAQLISQCGTEMGGGLFGSTYNAISSSGETVYFTVEPGECENGEGELGTGPAVKELYARVGEAETVDISEPSHEDCEKCNTGSRGPAVFEGASQDGSKAFFLSGQEGLLPGAEGSNLYEYDFKGTPHEKLVQVSGGVSAPNVRGVVRVSEDGSHVYFVAQGVLATNKNANNEEAITGDDNLYVFDSVTGTRSFIAALAAADGADWSQGDNRPVQATPDGDFLVFPSRAHLTTDDRSGAGVAQIFEYDAETGVLARVSVGQKGEYMCPETGKSEAGYNCDGNTENVNLAPIPGQTRHTITDFATQPNNNLQVSSNGSLVTFTSYDPLALGSTNSLLGTCKDAYEYRWSEKEGGIAHGNVSLVSDGQDVAVSRSECGTNTALIDPSGGDVITESTDRLVSQDTDTQRDFYDARMNRCVNEATGVVEGVATPEEANETVVCPAGEGVQGLGLAGFPAGVSRPGCTDACQGSLSLAPQLPGAGSVTQPGGGNLTAGGVVSGVKPKAAVLTRAQRLAKALTVCRKEKVKKRRRACETVAKKRYGGGKAKVGRGVSGARVKSANGRRK